MAMKKHVVHRSRGGLLICYRQKLALVCDLHISSVPLSISPRTAGGVPGPSNVGPADVAAVRDQVSEGRNPPPQCISQMGLCQTDLDG